jgi:hypothetical protein
VPGQVDGRGYLFSAFGDTTVREIKAAIAKAATQAAPA